MSRATSSSRADGGDDDDVEGHKFTLGAQQRVEDDDDVEGHKQTR